MRRRKHRSRYRRRMPFWLLPTLICVALLGMVTMRLRPLVLEYAASLVQRTAAEALRQTVQERIYQNRAEYESLVQFEHDEQNRVTALQTDVITLAHIKTELVDSMYEELNSLENTTLHVPIGTVVAPNYCSGWGPELSIGMVGLSSFDAEFANSFTSAGINQTRHNIMLETVAHVRVLTAFGGKTVTVKSNFALTDTVIVGSVPDTYTYIDDQESSLLGKINDYAETNP